MAMEFVDFFQYLYVVITKADKSTNHKKNIISTCFYVPTYTKKDSLSVEDNLFATPIFSLHLHINCAKWNSVFLTQHAQ